MNSSDEHHAEYMHGTGDAEQDRLEVLAKLLGGADFLPSLSEGMSVVEVGCGTGAIARDVAARVAPGEVVAFDREEAQIETAGRLASQHGIKNVHFRVCPAEGLDLPDRGVDAIYCRFLLEHVADPVRVLREMARVVKPGGWVCAYEWENSCGAIHPASPAVNLVWAAIYRLQDIRGGDSRIARQLYGLFREAGLSQVCARGSAWTITAEERDKLQGYVTGAREIIDQTCDDLLAEKLVTPADLAQAEQEYQSLLDSPNAYVFEGFCRVVGNP